ncbi:MAG: CDP-alcohol phosphatidyltransferase family protein [Myxococcota bacterium]|nr:CDP-alcohol phosphatidyltransferase family protein [Myxococcota bacterium]
MPGGIVGDEARERPQAWIVAMPRPEPVTSDPESRVWGLTAAERVRRSLLRAGVVRIESCEVGEHRPEASGTCLVLRDDLFYDERILAGLLDAQDVVLHHALAPDAPEPVAAMCEAARLSEVTAALRDRRESTPEGLHSKGILDLASAYNRALRKFDPPFVIPARDTTLDLAEVENQLFAASYKGITDLVTKWVFPLPARATVRVLAGWGVRPNTVTAFSYVLAVAVTFLFAEGWLALGLLLGWLMTFLDTVDGKLARCTLTSSRFGNVFDHALDLVHPPIWWAAWAMALPGGIADHQVSFWLVIGGYLVGRLLEGTFSLAFGIAMFVWRPFDGFFRAVIARRNPNLLLLSGSLLLGDPTLGFQAVAAWTGTCIVVEAIRNLQALIESWRGVEIRSWLDDRDPSEGVEKARS